MAWHPLNLYDSCGQCQHANDSVFFPATFSPCFLSLRLYAFAFRFS